VTDLQMPKMDGHVLLEHVSRRYPDVIRIVHSSRIDTHSAAFLGHLAHEVLVKPASAMQILTTTNRAMERSVWNHPPASARVG
jgi:DNA-binding NtrC family response regulator